MVKMSLRFLFTILILLLCACSSSRQSRFSGSEQSGESATPDLKNIDLKFPDNFEVEEIKLPQAEDRQIYNAVFAPNGSICLNLSRSIAIYDKQQRLIKTIPNSIGEFNQALATDDKGSIYVGANKNIGGNSIKVYNPNGEIQKTFTDKFTAYGYAIIRQIAIDKTGNIYVLIEYGTDNKWSIAVLNPNGQLIKEFIEGNVIPRSILMDEGGNLSVGCWYIDRSKYNLGSDTAEARLYKFPDITKINDVSLDKYKDYWVVDDVRINSVIDKNGILFLPWIAYYDNFNKSFEIDENKLKLIPYYYDIAGWTKDNNGNAVFWLGLIASSDGAKEYNTNLYRVKYKDNN